jgi:hypothetical protein
LACSVADLHAVGRPSWFKALPETFRFLVDAQRSVREYWVARRRREMTAVSWTWVVLAGVPPIIVVLCRELVSLCRHAVQRASIERIVRDSTGVIRIVDRTAAGDILEVEVLPSHEAAPGFDLRSARA